MEMLTERDPLSFPVLPTPARFRDEIGEGRFTLALGAFVWSAALALNLALACLPMVALALFLRPTPSLTWLVLLASLSLGPALSAGLYAARGRYLDPQESVFILFWRGYRRNALDAARITVPATVICGAVVYATGFGRELGLPSIVNGVLLGFALLVVLVSLHALALVTFFRLPWTNALTLGVFYLVRAWRTTLVTLALVVAAVALTIVVSDLLLALLGGLWVWGWYRASASMLRDSSHRFLASTHSPHTDEGNHV